QFTKKQSNMKSLIGHSQCISVHHLLLQLHHITAAWPREMEKLSYLNNFTHPPSLSLSLALSLSLSLSISLSPSLSVSVLLSLSLSLSHTLSLSRSLSLTLSLSYSL